MEKLRARGITLIEIMLVIVIGLMMLASATALYGMAKDSAGMTKAADKVLNFQQMIEQMTTNSGGAYPHLDQAASAWHDKRKDADKSPWGGLVSAGFDNSVMTAAIYQPPATTYIGVDGRAGCAAAPCPGGEVAAYPPSKADLAPQVYATPTSFQDNHPIYGYWYNSGGAKVPAGGLIEYRRLAARDVAGNPAAATASFFDSSLNGSVILRAYSISIRNPADRPVLFRGGAPSPR